MKKYVDKIPNRWYNSITTDPNLEFLEVKMNRYYNINESRKSNCTYIGKFETENDSIVDSIVAFFAALIGLFSNEGFRTVLRVVSTVICFVGFVGIIGSVEAGVMEIGTGIIFSVFLVFLEILCFLPVKSSK